MNLSGSAPPRSIHAGLVDIGRRWLRRQGFSVVATELSATGSIEQPDVIGFRATCSAIVEAKASRADFFADLKKPHRSASVGLGLYRFYLCPEGLLRPEEVPARWGLLYATPRKIVEVRKPSGNLWPSAGRGPASWLDFQHELDHSAERAILFSIARRLSAPTA